jgi:hypothetical protein
MAGTSPVPDLIDQLVNEMRTQVSSRLPADVSGELGGMSTEQLLILYGTWQGRKLAHKPRHSHISNELVSSSEYVTHRTTVRGQFEVPGYGHQKSPPLGVSFPFRSA